jgi:hypothetical protein
VTAATRVISFAGSSSRCVSRFDLVLELAHPSQRFAFWSQSRRKRRCKDAQARRRGGGRGHGLALCAGKITENFKSSGAKNGTAFRPTELFDGDWPPRVTLMDLIVEARTVNWDFNDWCDAGGYDASDPDARRMFECLLAYARREGRAGLN